MMVIIMMMLVPMLITMFTLLIKEKKYQENKSPFECGYSTMSETRMPFSNHFFMLAIMFLIFDVEIAIIIPIPMFQTSQIKNNSMIMCQIFLIILVVGLFQEWKTGQIEWIN